MGPFHLAGRRIVNRGSAAAWPTSAGQPGQQRWPLCFQRSRLSEVLSVSLALPSIVPHYARAISVITTRPEGWNPAAAQTANTMGPLRFRAHIRSSPTSDPLPFIGPTPVIRVCTELSGHSPPPQRAAPGVVIIVCAL